MRMDVFEESASRAKHVNGDERRSACISGLIHIINGVMMIVCSAIDENIL